MKIGATDLNATGSSFKKTEFFDVEANKANLYRVFPPLFSLADKGMISFYHKTHSIWLTSAKSGKQYPVFFKCIERKKDKVITQPCPLCDLNAKNKAMHEQGAAMLKSMPESEAKVAQQKQLNDFLKFKVMSTGAEGKCYLNVINVEGKAGVLKISFKQFEALKARLNDLTTNFKTDATGMTGIFLNFTKASAFKGDKNVTFAVDSFMENTTGPNGLPQMSFKYQLIDDATIAKMEADCKDLSLLYNENELSYDDILALANAFDDKLQLAAVAATIFKSNTASAPALSTAPAAAAPQVIAPVAQVEIPFAPTPTADQVVASATLSAAQVFAPPAVPAPAPVIAQAPVPAPAPVLAPAPVAPVVAPNSIFGATGQAAAPAGGLSNVSDDEFAKLFGG